MNKLEILAKALEYIEQHLQEDIKTEDVAAACYCSKATLEKMFRCMNQISVHDYLIRRRMMLAAKTIISVPGVNLLEVAVACGYSTNESFSRAFKSVWHCNPSEFRANPQYSELFPRLYPPYMEGDADSMDKNVDISELYELFKERKNCYFICFDVKRLTAINKISRKAGDLVILETLKRLEREAGPEDVVFRIGGDEFTALTNSEDIRYAEELCGRVKACNGIPVSFADKEIPLHLHTAVTKLSLQTVHYNDLFEQLHNVIEQIRNTANYDKEADTMSISKAWDWNKENNTIWRKPCEESYYIAERWKAQQQKDILDFGCGLGRHSIYFAKQGFSVSAFDLSEEAVSSLRQWAKDENAAVHTTVCDMLNLPYADNCFDGIFAYNVISHTDTGGMKTILAEIKRILRPGGEIFLSLCSKEAWAFKDSGYPKLDDNTVVVTDDGPEKGIPHFCVTLDDIMRLFHDFSLISVRHVDDCYFQGRKYCNSRRYFILAANTAEK